MGAEIIYDTEDYQRLLLERWRGLYYISQTLGWGVGSDAESGAPLRSATAIYFISFL